MMKALIASAAMLVLTIGPAAAQSDAKDTKATSLHSDKLDAVLMSKKRAGDKARDQYRNPKATLEFMGMTPDMTVAEYAPGGGWYTRVIAPYVAEKGKYIGIQFAPDPLPFPEDRKDRIRQFGATFPGSVAEWTGMDARKFSGYLTGNIPDELNGTVDIVFIPRMLHNLMRWNTASSEIKAMRALLKEDGVLAIVQHRAKADAPYSYTTGNRGYLREADVINLMDIHGFDLAKKSEINANPKDTADYEKGVWTLLPSLRTPSDDAETKAKYAAIGESDRMTLLFKRRP